VNAVYLRFSGMLEEKANGLDRTDKLLHTVVLRHWTYLGVLNILRDGQNVAV
jgi:hypothetical protein